MSDMHTDAAAWPIDVAQDRATRGGLTLEEECVEWQKLAQDCSRDNTRYVRKNLRLENQLAEYGEMLKGRIPWMCPFAEFDVLEDAIPHNSFLPQWHATYPVGSMDVEVRRWGAVILPVDRIAPQAARRDINLLRSSLEFELINMACDRVMGRARGAALPQAPTGFLSRHSMVKVWMYDHPREALHGNYRVVAWASGVALFDAQALDLTHYR